MPLMGAFVQAPLFISFFFAVSQFLYIFGLGTEFGASDLWHVDSRSFGSFFIDLIIF